MQFSAGAVVPILRQIAESVDSVGHLFDRGFQKDILWSGKRNVKGDQVGGVRGSGESSGSEGEAVRREPAHGMTAFHPDHYSQACRSTLGVCDEVASPEAIGSARWLWLSLLVMLICARHSGRQIA